MVKSQLWSMWLQPMWFDQSGSSTSGMLTQMASKLVLAVSWELYQMCWLGIFHMDLSTGLLGHFQCSGWILRVDGPRDRTWESPVS